MLDTHVLIWLAAPRMERFSARALEAYRVAEEVCYSVASEWEIAIKRSVGKLGWDEELMRRFEAGLTDRVARRLNITRAHCELVAALPLHHRDPFDRMLVAQAQVEGLSLLSADGRLHVYDLEVVW